MTNFFGPCKEKTTNFLYLFYWDATLTWTETKMKKKQVSKVELFFGYWKNSSLKEWPLTSSKCIARFSKSWHEKSANGFHQSRPDVYPKIDCSLDYSMFTKQGSWDSKNHYHVSVTMNPIPDLKFVWNFILI